MHCTDCRSQLDDFLDGHLAPSAQARLLGHLADCADCRARLAAHQQLLKTLRQLPAPSPRPGLATRVMPGKPRARSGWPAMAAAAAVLVLALTVSLHERASPPKVAPSRLAAADLVVPVRVVLRSAVAVRAVTIELELPDGTRLAAAGVDPRRLRWQADLRAGPNLLELPLVFERSDIDAELIARISLDGRARQFRVPVRSPTMSPPGARAPSPGTTGGPTAEEVHHV